jgi:hypothetical protein
MPDGFFRFNGLHTQSHRTALLMRLPNSAV